MATTDVALPHSVHLESGPNGLARLAVRDNRYGTAEIYLHGAQITSWVPPEHAPVLWLSAASVFADDVAIRGGVPICFPWFGGGPRGDQRPSHGYARLREWELTRAADTPDGVEIELVLPHAAGDLPLAATYRITVGTSLVLSLEVRNTSGEPVAYEEALHTYLAVSDIAAVGVEGLAGEAYLDRLGGPDPIVQEEQVVRVADELDRIYVGTPATVVVDDPQLRRRLVVSKTGSQNTVVWNPWTEKARAMADFGDEEYRTMLCVETANVRTGAVVVGPGESHTMTATIAAQPRP